MFSRELNEWKFNSDICDSFISHCSHFLFLIWDADLEIKRFVFHFTSRSHWNRTNTQYFCWTWHHHMAANYCQSIGNVRRSAWCFILLPDDTLSVKGLQWQFITKDTMRTRDRCSTLSLAPTFIPFRSLVRTLSDLITIDWLFALCWEPKKLIRTIGKFWCCSTLPVPVTTNEKDLTLFKPITI